jgi:hypothetical protein
VGGLGDEGSDQVRYRVGEEGEHGVGVPPMPCRHAGGVDLRRRRFDRAITQVSCEQAAVCEEWGGEGEESDPCMAVALVNDGPMTVLLEVDPRAMVSERSREMLGGRCRRMENRLFRSSEVTTSASNG